MRITWDDSKNTINQRKHGLSFDEASHLFLSGLDYLEIFDEAHSDDEDRFIAIGFVARGVAVVAWALRDDDEIRIISARLATNSEAALFHSYLEGTQ